jgi:hypothetical protein
MANSTFSGPLRSGTQRDGLVLSGTGVIGTFNLGRPVLAQSYVVPFGDMVTGGQARTICNLPAGSKIVDMCVEVTVAIVTATNLGIILGILGTTNKYYTTFNTGTSVVKVAQATVDAQMQVLATDNIGTADVPVLLTTTAATSNATAGSVTVTLYYIQRNADGT